MSITLKFLVIADTFGSMVRDAITEYWDDLQDCHAIIGLGDLPAKAYPAMREDCGLTARGICVLGNHDGQAWGDWLPRYKFDHAHNTVVAVRVGGRDFTIVGFGGSERYKRDGYWQWEDHQVRRAVRKLPHGDILITHTAPEPPEGYATDHRHRGLPPLKDYLEKHQPAVALHGHFHQNYRRQYGNTQLIGCYGAVILTCVVDGDAWQVDANPIITYPWDVSV